ncbi:hypothetical protein GDO81_024804 [Engystomops pustulosus]|uniref:Uncharacterized protein n=1 Tax=Engystomops pustulosus TaxID=76066 RepID=A0AAV6ZAV0_ENGPU|nr:hypothetical protein GDO81_024804 [Engystomops pustulosus]
MSTWGCDGLPEPFLQSRSSSLMRMRHDMTQNTAARGTRPRVQVIHVSSVTVIKIQIKQKIAPGGVATGMIIHGITMYNVIVIPLQHFLCFIFSICTFSLAATKVTPGQGTSHRRRSSDPLVYPLYHH